MSIRSRTLYNVQGLFVAPFSGSNEQPKLNNYKILRPIKNLQSINYSINQPNINLISFGNKSSVFKGNTGPTEISLKFSYLSDGLTNEERLDFNPYTFAVPSNEIMKSVAFSGLDLNISKDRKDFYLVTNQLEEDIYKKNSILDNQFYSPSVPNDIIDQKSKNYGLLHFQNAYLSRYNFSLSSRSIAVVSQEYLVDNMIFYSSGSGVKYTKLNLKSGTDETTQDTIIIPRSLSNLSGQNLLLSTEANVSFYKNINSGVLFESDMINSLFFNLEFQRNNKTSINYRFPRERNFKYPILGKIDINLNATKSLTGSFFDTLDKEINYNIIVDFNNNKNKVDPTKFIFSGCKFDNISYTNSTSNTIQEVSLSFNFEQDFSNNTKGLFWSGNAEWGLISNQKVLIF